MKKFMLVLTLVLLASCGAIDSLDKNCGNGAGCKFLFGKNDRTQNSRLDDLENDVEELKSKLEVLEIKLDVIDGKANLADNQINNINYSITLLEQEDSKLDQKITQLNNALNSMVNNVSSLQSIMAGVLTDLSALVSADASLQAQIDSLKYRVKDLEDADYQSQINNILIDIASLQNNSSVVKVYDPCGDHAGHFDEVILQLESGAFIAYMEIGQGQGIQKRFLTVLSNGNYITTDAQQCVFNISGDTITPATLL
jgi:chaperonin cofactor prefoldin